MLRALLHCGGYLPSCNLFPHSFPYSQGFFLPSFSRYNALLFLPLQFYGFLSEMPPEANNSLQRLLNSSWGTTEHSHDEQVITEQLNQEQLSMTAMFRLLQEMKRRLSGMEAEIAQKIHSPSQPRPSYPPTNESFVPATPIVVLPAPVISVTTPITGTCVSSQPSFLLKQVCMSEVMVVRGRRCVLYSIYQQKSATCESSSYLYFLWYTLSRTVSQSLLSLSTQPLSSSHCTLHGTETTALQPLHNFILDEVQVDEASSSCTYLSLYMGYRTTSCPIKPIGRRLSR